jgi:starch phosphorylase
MGIEPTVIHMNEGHSAFSAVERIRLLMTEHNLDYNSAKEAVTAGNVFTTHTPVPAGNETFSIDLVDRYLSLYWKELGIDKKQFMALGRFNPEDSTESFCMTILALKLSAYANGVSMLHGEVAREMWSRLWPEVPMEEIPITSITNGIHTRYWISHDMVGLFDRYLGPRWVTHPEDQTIWSRIDQIPDEELWRTHERRRERLVTFTRARLREQLLRRGAPATEVAMADEVLNPEALTIGFARRFAAYKRADLIFRDVERLKRIITKSKKPVQIILAGKAHPADNIGKEIIRKIIQIIAKEDLRRQIVLIENYDMNVSRYLVQGVDIWLNTPRRPNEASGTSGMKATANGAINLSVLDGWWPEAYDGENGWQIGMGQEYEDQTYQDDVESHAIYEVLEKEIIPTYYDRGPDGLPRRWIKRMKAAMRTICPIFNTSRMVRDYAEQFYLPADQRCQILRENNYSKAKELASWVGRINSEWKNIKINSVESNAFDNMPVGNEIHVTCNAGIGVLLPNEIAVQLYIGTLDMDGNIVEADVVPMIHEGPGENGSHNYSCKFNSRETGRHGYMVRILPKHVDLGNQFSTGLIKWS